MLVSVVCSRTRKYETQFLRIDKEERIFTAKIFVYTENSSVVIADGMGQFGYP